MGANSAWAGVTTLYSQDYQSASATDWTSPSYQSGLSIVTSGENKYHKWTNDNQNNRNAYNWFANSLGFTSYTEYTFSVRFCIGALPKGDQKTNLSEWAILGQNSSYTANAAHSSTSNYYLVLAQKTYGSTEYTVQVGSTTLDDAITLNVGTWYTLTQTISASSVTTIITDGSTEKLNNTNAVGYSTIGHLKGINLLAGRYWGEQYVDDILVTANVDEELITTPSISTAYSGDNRTVTITGGTSSEGNSVTTYYTIDGSDPTSESSAYTSPLDISSDCTVKAISISSTGTSSDVASQSVTVGKLNLNAPTLAKTAYSDGKYTVTMTNNQSNLAYVPASSSIYYTIDGGNATEYTAAIDVPAGSTVSAYVTATNYTQSAETSLTTAVRPIFNQDWTQDYTQVTSVAGTGVQSITISTTADFTVNERDFYNITGYGETSVSLNTNVGINTATGFGLRCNANNSGILKNSNSGGSNGYIGIQNLTAGQYIIITTNGNALSAEAGVELLESMSTTSEYVFRATSTAASIFFPHGTYNYVKTITVYNTLTLPTLSDGDAVRLTFTNATAGTELGDNWKMDVYNSSSSKVANVRADWWDEVAGTNTLYTYGYTYSTDGGATANNTNVWNTFVSDMANAAVDLTMSYTEGTLYVIGTMTNGQTVYYVNYKKEGLSGDLTYNLYGNNATLSNITTTSTTAVTAPAHPTNVAVATGSNGYATYANNVYPLDLTSATAYKAAINGSKVKFTLFNQAVPAGTGMLVGGKANGSVNLPIADASAAVSDNAFLVNASGKTFTAEANTTYYALINGSSPLTFGTFEPATLAFPATKAYLKVPSAAGARLTAVFGDDEATGIQTVQGTQNTDNGEYYNLKGQRVATPQKGLYIVNGKKMLMK